MKQSKFEAATRYLLAVALAVFGADKFFHFMPKPDPPEAGGKFLSALVETGYIFPTIGVVFLVAALLLMVRRVVLALLLDGFREASAGERRLIHRCQPPQDSRHPRPRLRR